MSGQRTVSSYEKYQVEVDRYFENNYPYEPLKPLRINLREYLQYAEDNKITDVSEIPDEILDSFMLPEKPQSIAQ